MGFGSVWGKMGRCTVRTPYPGSSTALAWELSPDACSSLMLLTSSVRMVEEVAPPLQPRPLVIHVIMYMYIVFTGQLCGDCQPGYGVTFDLRYCKQDCGVVGIIVFIGICVVTLIVSLIVLYFDLPLPNELKSVIFFAQVTSYTLSRCLPLTILAPVHYR